VLSALEIFLSMRYINLQIIRIFT